jgi:hypothetical protein
MKQHFYKEPTNKFGTCYGYAQVLAIAGVKPIVVQYHASWDEVENRIAAGSAMVYSSKAEAEKVAEMEIEKLGGLR